MEKEQISSIQMFLLLVGFLNGSTVIMQAALSAKNDAWLAILIGGVGGVLLMGVYVAIVLLNPSKTLVDILKNRFGKLMGSVVAIMYIWYFIHLAALVLRNFGEFIIAVSFPETPMIVVSGILTVILVYAINSGIEVLARLSELFVPILPIVALVICLALVTTNDFTAFFPILENGMAPVLKAAFGYITFPFGETVAFLMVFPHLNRKGNLKKTTILAAMFMVAFSLLYFFRDITVLGSDMMQQAVFVPHLTAMLIPGLNVEPLVDINLLIGGGIKSSICIYAATRALSQVAGIGDYRKLTVAVATFCVVFSIWVYENVFEMFSWAERIWPYYSIPFQIFIPLLVLVLSLRKRDISIKNNG